MSETNTPQTITLVAAESPNLDVTTYRGSARLCDLTRISQVDVFDQDTNPKGLQRDLAKPHALGAYDYVARPADKHRPRAFPEVMLNVRDRKVVTIDTLIDAGTSSADNRSAAVDVPKVAALTFDLDAIDKASTVKVSRVDGNHRLFFGMGDGKDRPPVEAMVPFSITIALPKDAETNIFTDVNAEQKGLNTSHLATLRGRLTPDELLFAKDPAGFIARRLVEDEASPWFDKVHLGGSKRGAKEKHKKRPVNFIALKSAVHRILRKSTYLGSIETVDGKYGLIRGYWQAVRLAAPEAWDDGTDYMILKSTGVNTLAEFGAAVIDRALASGDVEVEDMAGLVQHGLQQVSFRKDSDDIVGMHGNQAVLALTARMSKGMPKTGRGKFSPTARDVVPEDDAA